MNEMLFYDLRESPGLAYSLSAQVAREIGRRIVSGTYAPDQLIEDEQKLSERYRVSRSVIRDAVKVLVGKGLLEVRRGIGTRVRPRSSWGLLDDDVLAWHHSAPSNPEFLRQLMDIRKIIEPKAARWAAERGSAEDLEQIGQALAAMRKTSETQDDFIISDARFHQSILQAANNEFLLAMQGIIFLGLLYSLRVTNPDTESNVRSIPLHENVYEAVRQGDGDAAEHRMDLLMSDASSRLSLKASG
ncbi:MAG: FadR/GntR family transcriptional regulator [Rhodobacteraceae bacterium]|nr:FadR/GntR family transcriptional regulator [Paracoccaceae bacterium]